MSIYLNSRELADKLGINLAKWKRWAREFLGPDPLGGIQSGYARQFSHKDAFRVYLGGCLVGRLKYTVPEAGQILFDLDVWLSENGFYAWSTRQTAMENRSHHIYVYRLSGDRLGYAIRSIDLLRTRYREQDHAEHFTLTLINLPNQMIPQDRFSYGSVIYIDNFYRDFLEKIEML